jgi:hypothetical protein
MKTFRYRNFVGCIAVGFAASLFVSVAVAQISAADAPAAATDTEKAQVEAPVGSNTAAVTGAAENTGSAPAATDESVAVESQNAAAPATDAAQGVEAAEAETAKVIESPDPASPAKPRYNRDDVRWIQQRLAELGYYNGTVDGAYGRVTREAIKAYQVDQELEQDGRPTPELREFMWRNGG